MVHEDNERCCPAEPIKRMNPPSKIGSYFRIHTR